jgi:hypothetical protein
MAVTLLGALVHEREHICIAPLQCRFAAKRTLRPRSDYFDGKRMTSKPSERKRLRILSA